MLEGLGAGVVVVVGHVQQYSKVVEEEEGEGMRTWKMTWVTSFQQVLGVLVRAHRSNSSSRVGVLPRGVWSRVQEATRTLLPLLRLRWLRRGCLGSHVTWQRREVGRGGERGRGRGQCAVTLVAPEQMNIALVRAATSPLRQHSSSSLPYLYVLPAAMCGVQTFAIADLTSHPASLPACRGAAQAAPAQAADGQGGRSETQQGRARWICQWPEQGCDLTPCRAL